ncbi:very short patch repair endonuclease [Bradyrhizobium sp. BR 1433]|uniref:very short patch repair endonuclease n=1 Tax=Bradyrhizobium sp. BR 1433 TaxID=3447967 RepID=UPI003EE6D689
MIDLVDKITRSRMMAGIRGKNTKPELALRYALHRQGLRYRLHVATLPGRPDIVMPKYRAIVQVQGCFWHRHEGCSFATIPASNTKFWNSKFVETVRRDQRNVERLRDLGWRVAVVWECAINKEGGDVVATRVARWLSSSRPSTEIPVASSVVALSKAKSRN